MHAETPSIGPYRLLEPLGQGAMGVVYRAQHSLTGTLVALKTVHVPRAAVLQCIRREIHALLRLSHPGVVRVLDAGLDDEKPWYAMELLDGSDLRESWNGRLGVRAPSGIPQAALHEGLGTLHQLCEALAYVHGEGLVHRDLKPGNIFLVRDGRTVLVDFGLASRFAGLGGREALEAAAEAGGTLAYMAPEQGRGQLVDARADLYSLGCILYELLTGRPPFVADHPIQVLRQHFEVEPRPPSELVDGLPGGLEDLVLRLLAKDPRDRIGHADDVAATLAALGAKDGPHEVTPRARPYLYRSGLVGRRAVMDRLRQRLEALQQRRGCLLLIGGESGAGKTRLAVELGREAARLKLQVLAGECLDGPTPPLGALRETLRLVADRCQEGGEHEMQRLLGPRARLLARYEPRIGTLPGVRAQPDPPPLPGQLDRIRLFTALRKTLQALFDRRPGLLLLDDLQWADELTLGFLQFLQQSQRSEAIALLMVGTYRSEQATLQLQDLVRSCPADQRVLLQPLDEAAIGEMAGEMLGLERAPELFGAFLASRCGGSPFFVSEYLHAAVAEELLYRDEQGRWQAVEPAAGAHSADETYTALPLPRSLRQLVERRLEGLPAGAQALVEAAAVIGRQVPLELLRQMLRLEPAALFEAAAEPLRRHVMEEVEPERPQRAASLRFRHDQLREVALERIAPDRRRPLHRAAAEAIEQLDAEARNEHLAELALHWEAAGEPVLARSLYLIAAKGARGRHLHDEAVRLYRAYLRLPATPDAESLQARFELVDCLQHFGGPASEVLEEQARVLAEARFLEDRRAEGECLKLMARTCSISGRIDEASSFLDQALAVARKNGDRHLEGAILDNTGSFHRRLGRKDEARELYRQALQIHADLGNRAFEGASVGNLAALFHEEGRLDEAEALYKQALAIHRTAGSQRWEGHVLSNLGLLCMQRGRIAEARTHCEQALTIHQQIGDRGAAFVLGCLGHLHFRLGHLDQARGLYEQALELDQEFGDPGREGRTLYGLGVVHQALGLHEEAGALYERALELHRSIPDRPFEGFTLGAMASLRFEQGELEVAGKFYEEALDRLREVANQSREGEVLGRSVLLRLAQGDVEDAKARCRQALALARETAEPLNEALALAGAAQVERLGGGELEEARRLVQQALSAMRLIAERLELGPCLCEAGHVELALGRSANRPLSEARRLVEEQDLSPRSALFQAVEKLARAQAAFDKGAVLLRGQCPEDVPAGLRPLLEGIGRASVVSHRGGDMTGMEGTAAPAN